MAEDAVLAELADLRRQVAALSAAVGATRSVHLRTIGPAAFLGQPGAIDVYVRDFGRGIADSVNAWDVMAVWRTVEASVLAFVQGAPADGAAGSSVRGMGMLTVTFRDWLPPWLRAYEDLARSLSSLPQDLRDVRTLGGDAGRLLRGAYA